MTNGFAQASLAKVLGIFALVLIVGQAALFAVGYFFPNLPVPSSIGIVLVMVAAMSAGQSYARQTGARPSGGEKLVFAVLASLVSAAIGVGMVWGMFQSLGVPFTLENVAIAISGNPSAGAEMSDILPIVLGIAALLTLVLCWLGYGFGARNQLKQQERLAAKGR